MQQDTMDAAGEGVPVDGLVERAQSAIRFLTDAREATEEGAQRLLNAYETVKQANEDLSDELQAKDLALAAAAERAGRLEAEIERLKSLSREAIQAVKVAQDERDRAREEVRLSRDNYDKLNATHENLIATNAKLTNTFDKLLTEVGTGSRVIRDGSRRLSDMVAPTPARPRAPRLPEPAEAQLEREVREAASQAAAQSVRTAPRLVALEGNQRPDNDIVDGAERAEVDGLIGRLAAATA